MVFLRRSGGMASRPGTPLPAAIRRGSPRPDPPRREGHGSRATSGRSRALPLGSGLDPERSAGQLAVVQPGGAVEQTQTLGQIDREPPGIVAPARLAEGLEPGVP